MRIGKIAEPCPNCGHNEWYLGPCGGLSQNVKCVECGALFNECSPMFPLEQINDGGFWPKARREQ